MTRLDAGSRNLIILGAAATVIAIVTTGISLKVYHDSGDIYLDRSRPGFLPDEEEAQEEMLDYDFAETGPVNRQVLDEYLKHYQETMDELDSVKEPFSANPLSDESLGLPAEKTNQT